MGAYRIARFVGSIRTDTHSAGVVGVVKDPFWRFVPTYSSGCSTTFRARVLSRYPSLPPIPTLCLPQHPTSPALLLDLTYQIFLPRKMEFIWGLIGSCKMAMRDARSVLFRFSRQLMWWMKGVIFTVGVDLGAVVEEGRAEISLVGSGWVGRGWGCLGTAGLRRSSLFGLAWVFGVGSYRLNCRFRGGAGRRKMSRDVWKTMTLR